MASSLLLCGAPRGRGGGHELRLHACADACKGTRPHVRTENPKSCANSTAPSHVHGGVQPSAARLDARLAVREEPLPHRREGAEGREDAGAPDLELPRLVARQGEGGKRVRREPTDLLHVAERCPVGEPVLGVHKCIHKGQYLSGVVGAHCDLCEPQGLLLPPVQALKVVAEDLVVAPDLRLHLLGRAGVGMDLDGVNDIPTVRRCAGEVPARHVEGVLFELRQPAVAHGDAAGQRGVHAKAGVLAPSVARHGR
mmetsp:Transcript_78540/g.244638  ORF Transcript_78540/g.244638 Transcript_78540/m.244638 type:complete len:254 (-) Transcript_78540:507-1268(-)